MKDILKKTEADRRQEMTFSAVTVSETINWFWVCDECNKAFFDKDVIFYSTEGGYHCPNKKGIFRKKTCMKNIMGGNEKCFNRYYKFN